MSTISEEDKRKDLIEYFIHHCAEIVPYDDSDYYKKLTTMAEHYADEILDPNSHFNQIVKLHDEMLDDNCLIDF